MKPLVSYWNKIARQIRQADRWLVLFDYDGTLTAIVATPEKALLPAAIREELRTLARQPRCDVGIVTGRSIRQARQMVGLPGLIYVGNHGLEIQHNGWGFIHPEAETRVPLLKRLIRTLNPAIKAIPGARLEDKDLTISVHHRQVPPPKIRPLVRTIRNQLEALPGAGSFSVRAGKKVLEIQPVSHWNKGSALIWLRNFQPPRTLILYIGDDETDEDAFRVLRKSGISIRVGFRRHSNAQYYVRTQRDVHFFLERLIALMQSGEGPHG